MGTTVNNLRKGNVIRFNGDSCLVVEATLRTPPNLRSFFQMSVRSLTTGKVQHARCNVGESFDVLHTEVKKLEFSYEDQGVYNFMDPQTFENSELPRDVLEDAIQYLVPNKVYDILFVDERPVTVNLPGSIEMKVTEAPDAVRGDTASNVQKSVTVETGLVVQTPIFIKTGDIIRISTADGSYQGRA